MGHGDDHGRTLSFPRSGPGQMGPDFQAVVDDRHPLRAYALVPGHDQPAGLGVGDKKIHPFVGDPLHQSLQKRPPFPAAAVGDAPPTRDQKGRTTPPFGQAGREVAEGPEPVNQVKPPLRHQAPQVTDQDRRAQVAPVLGNVQVDHLQAGVF